MDRGWKPNVEISPNCPRCGSSNTKFCYYNNYSLTQPRYFCKGCRRYWTKGGSLRNVPVGGGCRKNRRGKSVRLSTDAASVYSKSLAHGVGGNGSVGQAYGSKGNSLFESTSDSSTIRDGSHIDLALVYANFLNQQPDTNKSSTGASEAMPELPTECDPCLDFSSTACTTLDSTYQLLPEENGPVGSLSLAELSLETHFREDDQMYYSAFDSVHPKHYQDGIQIFSSHNTISHNTRAFPPLPSEEMNPQEILWLNSQMMVNHSIQTTQEPMPGPEAARDPNLLFANWSPFDFSSDDTFSKTREI